MESEITFHLTILPAEPLQVLGWSQQAVARLLLYQGDVKPHAKEC